MDLIAAMPADTFMRLAVVTKVMEIACTANADGLD
jgi:hypothetical protein